MLDFCLRQRRQRRIPPLPLATFFFFSSIISPGAGASVAAIFLTTTAVPRQRGSGMALSRRDEGCVALEVSIATALPTNVAADNAARFEARGVGGDVGIPFIGALLILIETFVADEQGAESAEDDSGEEEPPKDSQRGVVGGQKCRVKCRVVGKCRGEAGENGRRGEMLS